LFSCFKHAAVSTLKWSRPFICYTVRTSFYRGILRKWQKMECCNYLDVAFSLYNAIMNPIRFILPINLQHLAQLTSIFSFLSYSVALPYIL
jgi:hypothetical protein